MKKLLKVSSILAIVLGVAMVVGGILGLSFTYKNVARENIKTPEDATIPGVSVRGPLTLKTQTDIIRKHTLKTTGGKTYAEMPRQIPKLDQNNNPILDENGKPVMISNSTRDMWVTATTLTTALNLAILAYAFSGLILFFGLVLIWGGIVLFILNKRY